VIFALFEDSIARKTQIQLSDDGDLKFDCIVTFGKAEVKKEMTLILKEVIIDELKRLKMRVEKLENEMKVIKQRVEL
jgi:hypothetical protein